MAHLVAVNKSDCRTDPKVNIGEGELRAGHGLVGDSHAGLGEREVSLVALESIEAANHQYGIEAGPGAFADNLTTQGINLMTLKLGDRLRVGETLLEVVQIGKALDASHTYNFQGVSILPKCGIFCKILTGGYVKKGDIVAIVKPEPSNS